MTPKRYPSEAVSDAEDVMSGKRLSRRSTVRIPNFFCSLICAQGVANWADTQGS